MFSTTQGVAENLVIHAGDISITGPYNNLKRISLQIDQLCNLSAETLNQIVHTLLPHLKLYCNCHNHLFSDAFQYELIPNQVATLNYCVF